MEEVDRRIEELFHAHAPGRKPDRSGHGKKAKSSRAVYKYARTQQLYRLNPGLLAKHAKEGINWTEEPKPDLGSDDIKGLYDSLWGTKPPIDPPAFGTAETPKPFAGTGGPCPCIVVSSMLYATLHKRRGFERPATRTRACANAHN